MHGESRPNAMDPFVLQHGSNAPGSCVRQPNEQDAVRKKVERIRGVLQQVFDEEGLDLKASDIIRSEETSTHPCVTAHATCTDSLAFAGRRRHDFSLPFPEVPGQLELAR